MCRKLIYLVSFVCLLGLANNASAEIPRDPNLVIFYSYEDVGMIVPDESGRGHHGTVNGDISECLSGIKWYGAAEFQGIWGPTGYSYLDLDSPNYPAEDIPRSAITLAAWAKCRKTGQHHALMSTRASDNTWVMHPQINDDETFRWLLRTYGGTTIFNLNGVGSHGWDEWLHYTGTYDSVTGKGILYINGEVCAKIDVPPGQPIADWGTGARVGYNIDNARPFTGVMDELYLFTRALSQAEIGELMFSDGPPSEKASHSNPGNGTAIDTTETDLLWLPGAYAVSNNVYFGESFEDVNNGTGDTFKGNVTEAQFTVAGLVRGTTYYWRIDGVNTDDPNSPWKGDVWSFLLRPTTAWNPDPSDGAKWVDPNANLGWSPGWGAVTHSVYFGDNFDDVNNAAGAPPQEQTTYDPAGALGFEKVYYWRVDEIDNSGTTHKGNVWSLTTMRSDSGIKGEYYTEDFETLVLTRKDPGINYNWGDAAPDPQVPTDNFSVRWTGELEVPFTSDWTFTASCDEWVRLWVDNVLLFDKWEQQGGVEWTGTINLAEGQKYSIVMEHYENTGNARAILYWNSPYWLSPYQSKQVIPQGAFSLPLWARSPRPASGTEGLNLMSDLSWGPGDFAGSHEVYLGTDADAVANATKASPEYKGGKAIGEESFDPGQLLFDTTYFWRIDEVNATNPDSPWVGNVWTFWTGDFVVVEDFEAYNDINEGEPGSNRIYLTWIDGFGTTTNGAVAGNLDVPLMSQGHSSALAMPVSHDNAGKTSEVTRTLDFPTDWTANGVTKLSLWFQGAAGNAADRMFVALGNAIVYHPDDAATQGTGWNQWVIDLAEFAGVDLTNVNTITIGIGTQNSPAAGGTGTMYFDDIRLIR